MLQLIMQYIFNIEPHKFLSYSSSDDAACNIKLNYTYGLDAYMNMTRLIKELQKHVCNWFSSQQYKFVMPVEWLQKQVSNMKANYSF